MSALRTITARLDHRWAAPRLSAYLDGDLPPRQERRLRSHASICPECGRALRRLATLVRALPRLRARPEGTLGDRTAEAVRRRIDEEPGAPPS